MEALSDTDTKPATDPASPGLDAVMAQAQALEGTAGPAAGVQAAPAVDNAAELLGALEMARLMVAPMFSWWADFDRVWSDSTLKGIAQGGGAVMERHGWTMGGVLGEWGPYLALIGATAPPAFATYQAIKLHQVEQRRRPAPTPAPAPGETGQAAP
jgi:hypothetical protein